MSVSGNILETISNYNSYILNKINNSSVDESTISGLGFTKNAGTITGISMNGSNKGTSGVVDLGTVITSETKANWNETNANSAAYIQNKPTIPAAANNSTITIQKNGTTVDSFTTNASANKTINITTNELPAVTTADNGKILMVVDGAWMLVTPVSIYTGSEEPNNSLGNNGDIYLVV